MTDSYPLIVTRNNGPYALIRGLALFVSTPTGRVRVGNVRSGRSVEIEVPRHATALYGKVDWCRSESIALSTVSPGEVVYANMRFSLNPLRLLGVMAMPCRFELTKR